VERIAIISRVVERVTCKTYKHVSTLWGITAT
jgi:hypothetical protein